MGYEEFKMYVIANLQNFYPTPRSIDSIAVDDDWLKPVHQSLSISRYNPQGVAQMYLDYLKENGREL